MDSVVLSIDWKDCFICFYLMFITLNVWLRIDISDLLQRLQEEDFRAKGYDNDYFHYIIIAVAMQCLIRH